MYEYSVTEWLLFFYSYCFLGWLWESCFVSLKKRKWVNRGFMHGPFLPIYGVGAISMLVITLPVKEKWYLVLIGGMIGATVLEYITGAIMEALFGVRYWDYSGRFCNVKGYICLCSTLAWGGFTLLMENVLQPNIADVILMLSQEMKSGIAWILTLGMGMDTMTSFNEAMDLKEILVHITKNNEEIRGLRKRLEEVISLMEGQGKEIYGRAEESKQALSWRWREEKKYKEVKLAIEKYKAKQEELLEELSERANIYIERISERIKKGEEVQLEKLKKEVTSIKKSILKQQQKIRAMGEQKVFRSTKILGRNPNTVSMKYEEALKKLKLLGGEKGKK